MILVISSPSDDQTQAVLKELRRLGAAFAVFDYSWFPQHSSLIMRYDGTTNRSFELHLTDGTKLALTDCKVVWWARPQPFTLHSEIQTTPRYQRFAYNESSEAISGLWHAIDAFWVNHPICDQAASRKPYQLRVAQEVGLEIPRTLITNDPDRARDFIAAQSPKKTVYKTFMATEEAWRETRIVKQHELKLIESVRYAPVIFQKYIEAECDLRITIVGDEIFATAFYSQETSYGVDYRMDMERARVKATHLTAEVERRLHNLMDRLGLVYGAIDMRLTPDGRYVFLEINPEGLWRFVEERTGQPITASLAGVLASHDR